MEADPSSSSNHAAQALGRHQEAVAVAAHALELARQAKYFGGQPDLDPPIQALVVQSTSLFELSPFEGTAAASRQILRHHPDGISHWFVLTRSLASPEQWAEALEAVNRWIELDSSPTAWSYKAKALLELGRYEDAGRAGEPMNSLRP
ncbi:hypothetical protein Aple_018240 [Acrocarpospora pleiomorpha]|uniref:Tetratricopeptide repeat protein n=1 Tax=Acrocarpospora pleiomorpha TaxID=90975 RepID=A0A5M3XFK5_9ACTN|nr:hypothetical protein [Acrocarpospora pleiomorpha]GES18929.1 hypothetical protein Aple_018240 [Acrocarpospora pleiomorpha]